MAQSVYSGIQGSGKSFEVVRSVIVPNIAKGRRVVTNVAGLQYEKICDYCVEKLGADRSKLGTIVQVENEVIETAAFFPLEESENPFIPEREAIKKLIDSTATDKRSDLLAELAKKAQAWRDSFIVKGGDIVILDECWRWYTSDAKLPDGHLKFFRMHRHFLHPETGQCCDIVLICQDIGDLRRNIRATVEKSFLMKKHTDLGLMDRYLITAFSGNKQTKSAVIQDWQEKYNPEIFALYQSHSQKKEGTAPPKEERADKRGNLFSNKLFKIVIPLGIVWLCIAVWFVWKFFHPAPVEQPSEARAPIADGVKPVAQKVSEGYSSDWRLVGSVDRSGSTAFVIQDSQGRFRTVSNPPAVKVSQGEIELALPNKEFVSYWSGTLPGVRK